MRSLYSIKNLIAEGINSKIYNCTKISDKKKYVMKITPIENMVLLGNRYKTEYNILSKLEHDSIIKINQAFEYKDKHHIVTDYYKNGDLFDYTNNNGIMNDSKYQPKLF